MHLDRLRTGFALSHNERRRIRTSTFSGAAVGNGPVLSILQFGPWSFFGRLELHSTSPSVPYLFGSSSFFPRFGRIWLDRVLRLVGLAWTQPNGRVPCAWERRPSWHTEGVRSRPRTARFWSHKA